MSISPTIDYKHVYPLGDLKEHVTDGSECWCRPVVDDLAEVVVHNSLDRRELTENILN